MPASAAPPDETPKFMPALLLRFKKIFWKGRDDPLRHYPEDIGKSSHGLKDHSGARKCTVVFPGRDCRRGDPNVLRQRYLGHPSFPPPAAEKPPELRWHTLHLPKISDRFLSYIVVRVNSAGLVPITAVIVRRLLDEERFLIKNLPAYAEYKNKVKYRLIPFVWQNIGSGSVARRAPQCVSVREVIGELAGRHL
jgi:hypothetical protein